jgi:SET domain-containing protein
MSGTEPRPSGIEGRGLFATRPHRAGERLAVYHGPVVTEPPGPDREGRLHALELGPGRWIDGRDPSNLARLANHSCRPTAEAVRVGDTVELRALADLAEGAEVTFDYGLGLAEALGNPCRCGAPGCPGFIVAEPLRPLLRRQLRGGKARD